MCDSCAAKVAILIAIPVTESGFVKRVAESDWLRKFNDRDLAEEERLAQLEDIWRDDFRPNVAEPLQELLAMATRRGIRITLESTLEALVEATASATIVILFGHWKGFELLHDDFVQPVDRAQFVCRAAADPTSLGKWLNEHLTAKEHAWWGSSWLGRKASVPDVRSVLAESIERLDDDIVTDDVDLVLESPLTRLSRRRDEIDALFAELITPGNRLELYDGLHAKEDIEGAIAPGFESVLDLTTCTSAYLADHIGAQSNNRVRTVQFPKVQSMLWAAECVALTLELHLDKHIPYQQARAIATAIMEQVVSERAR